MVLSHSVMSNPLQLHGLEPIRLLCPQNFSGKSTGDKYPRVCLCAQLLNHVQLFVTSWSVACQAYLSMEFSKQE